MQIQAVRENPTQQKVDILFLAVDENLESLSKQPNLDISLIKPQLESLNFAGKLANLEVLVNTNSSINAKLILVAGLGNKEKLTLEKVRKVFVAALAKIQGLKAKSVYFQTFGTEKFEAKTIVRLFSEVSILSSFKLMDFKSKDKSKNYVENIFIAPCCQAMSDEEHLAKLSKNIELGKVFGEAKNRARKLGDTPANVCTPEYLANTALEIGKEQKKLKVTVLGEKEILKKGMNSLYSVGKGSANESKLISIEYNNGEGAPYALVGKGITFDSGGISLKPGEAMDEMKYDMLGAASVISTMEAIAKLDLPINVVAVAACAENLPSGTANKPGDIWTTMSGLTVEVLNTDAEGRLVLCDALTYSQEEYKPKAIIDIATLTGACIIALGHHATGVLGNDEDLIEEVLQAGKQIDDRGWQLPLWDEFQEQLKSNFADMQNIGGRPAGTITAAKFLSNFTEGTPWVHLDVAGTAWNSGKEKGATGRPVGMLLQYLLNQAEK